MHRLKSDEVFHFYAGDAVEMLQLQPDGRGSGRAIGNDLLAGERPQVVVDAGYWQGSRLVEGGKWALLGCTVSPGFEYEDYESGDRKTLLASWPEHAALILKLTQGRRAWGVDAKECIFSQPPLLTISGIDLVGGDGRLLPTNDTHCAAG